MAATSNYSAAMKAANYISKVITARSAAYMAACNEAGEEVRNEVVRELSHAGGGRVYGRHRASAPGSPPAPDTGTLRNSIYVQIQSAGPIRKVIKVGTRVPYATFLEYGTSKMRPRPFMRPAVARAAPIVARTVTAKVMIGLP